jgi:hypothetical protein
MADDGSQSVAVAQMQVPVVRAGQGELHGAIKGTGRHFSRPGQLRGICRRF